jgi:transcriptional repressor NrdR
MRCPWCGESNDRVVDSREVEGGSAVRRRRECEVCSRRFTTFERVEQTGLTVVKRSGRREPFSREKVAGGIRSATKNRPFATSEIDALVDTVTAKVRSLGPEVTSEQIGTEVLDRLRELDEVAYLRFASVYKGFEEVGDFQREAGLLAPDRGAASSLRSDPDGEG